MPASLRPVLTAGALLAALAVPAGAAPHVAGFERFFAAATAAADQAEGGRLLLTELNCVSCHAAPAGWAGQLAPRAPLSLADVGSRLDAATLAAFVRDPAHHKPGTAMPALAADADVPALAAYLASLRDPSPVPAPAGNAARGAELYRSVGCVACHVPDPAKPAAAPGGIPLRLGLDYATAELTRFLHDPLATRPAGRMPDLRLSAQEAADIAAHLKSLAPAHPAPAAAANATPELLATGRARFAALNCQACHDVGAATPAVVAARPLATLDAEAGCLAVRPPAGVPHFALSDGQRTALRAALAALRAQPAPAAPAPALVVERKLTELNCYACHSRGGRGGVERPRLAYFHYSDPKAEALGDFGFMPPALDHTGRKLQRGWLERLLWGEGGTVRPYMATRMPRFGRANLEPVLDAWSAADALEKPVAIDTSGMLLHQRAHYGRTLMGTNDGGLGCITCHGLKDKPALGIPAINLTHTTDRLAPAYFKELLLNPQATQPGTLMPPMFLGRPKADQEIEQLWTYLREIDQQRLPDGLLPTGEYEMKPAEAGRPLFLRTFLEGAGFQAIAVGFPAGRHAAFDAAEIRWALTWSGRFLDAMTTWEERAMTPARPLGESVVALPGWMPLARLAAPGAAWPDTFGPAAGYAYRGMTLAADGTPTFHYTIGGLTVADTLTPAAAGGYDRRLVLTGGSPGWWFRGARADARPVPVTFDAGGAATLQEHLP